MSAAMFGPRKGFSRKPRSKFGANPTEYDGIKFHSNGEASRYATLKLQERAGIISHLKLQPSFPLGTDDKPVVIRSEGYPNGRRVKYIADFEYVTDDGSHVVEDFKGLDTPTSRLKRAMVEAQYGIRILITGARK